MQFKLDSITIAESKIELSTDSRENGERTMLNLKTVIVVTSIVATAAALGACRKQVTEQPMKLGAADTVVEEVALS